MDTLRSSRRLLDWYKSLVGFLDWQDLGMIVAGGNLRIGDIKGKPEIEKARNLGASIA